MPRQMLTGGLVVGEWGAISFKWLRLAHDSKGRLHWDIAQQVQIVLNYY